MKLSSVNIIEVSSLCDNKCAYCPAPIQHQWRPTGNMTLETFERAVDWVRYFVNQRTQTDLNLHGIGEPTLNPHLVEMISLARNATPGIINFNTNGNSMTEELALACKDAGITSINVTGHNAESTMVATRAIRRVGLKCDVNQDFAVTPNNWADQITWTDRVDYSLWCRWLDLGWVMVMWDGRVTRCCLDAKGRGVFADVRSGGLPFFLDNKPFGLCIACHHFSTVGPSA